MSLSGRRVGYVPYSSDLSYAGDRRRFPFYARRRGIDFELARPGGHYDVVVLASVADITRWAAHPRPTRLVYELIEPYLALAPSGAKSRLRGPAKFLAGEIRRPTLNYHRAIEAMCRRADAVVCSTEEQRRQLLAFCPNVHVVLDAHGELGSVTKTHYAAGDTLHLVWEGLGHTVEQFREIGPVLAGLASHRPVALHLVTDLRYGQYARRFPVRDTLRLARSIFRPVHLYAWSTKTMPPIVTACDLAVIPLRLSDPFAAGKPENKLLLLWRLGMPALASATPAYRRAMAACGLEMTCADASEWSDKLARYAGDEAARRQAGEAGRRFVEDHHGDHAVLGRWDRLFETLP